jgi:hypothetical protein
MLTAHLTTSVGWVGALAVFLAHAATGLVSQDVQIIRAACLAMGITAWFVILPLSVGSAVTGIVQALGTAWGLIRHYWVLAKLLLTGIATSVLLLKLVPISGLSAAAAEVDFSPAQFAGLRVSLFVHALGGLLVLLTIATVAVYKPSGLTPYGTRALREQSARGAVPPGLPRWVKAVGVAIGVFVLLVAAMLLHGGHGPSMHGG